MKLLAFSDFKFEEKLDQQWDQTAWIEIVGELQGLPLTVLFFLSDETNCRRVQVGTKETPVYEIQCEDGASVEDLFNTED